MLVPPTFSWMSRATMPLVSVTMAWARETPGVSTPPTVVKAPNLRTSRRLSGLNIVPSFAIGKGWANLVDSTAAILQLREPAMKLPGFVSTAMSLREATAVIFVLISLLPLLLFVSILSVSDLISKTEAQFAAFMAVVIACLGFVVFRRLVDQIVRLATRMRLPTGAGDAILGPTDAPERVPALGHVGEIGQLTGDFHQMRDELRASSERLEDLVSKLGTLHELVELSARIPRIDELLPAFLQRSEEHTSELQS